MKNKKKTWAMLGTAVFAMLAAAIGAAINRL